MAVPRRTVLGHLLFLAAAPVLPALSGQSAAAACRHPDLVATFGPYARTFRRDLIEAHMPFWHDATIDREQGGYLLEPEAPDGGPPTKLIVTQARLVWGFAHAHRKGLSDGRRNYLRAARHGYRFIHQRFFDPDHGGYFWLTDRAGRPVNTRKILYGQAFVLYALVEYYRASRVRGALERAVALYSTVERRLRDRAHGGWREHGEADWRPIAWPVSGSAGLGRVGLKHDNPHFHWMEALIEFFDVLRREDPARARALGVAEALRHALAVNAAYFFPWSLDEAATYYHPDWRPAVAASEDTISFGHAVEVAWLMARAREVLGAPRPFAPRSHRLLAHALAHGYDHARGGLYDAGARDGSAVLDTDKAWWPQAEMLAALTVAVCDEPRPAYVDALHSLLDFLTAHQIDPADAVWWTSVSADGVPLDRRKIWNWKANYHDLRAMVMFVEAFDPA